MSASKYVCVAAKNDDVFGKPARVVSASKYICVAAKNDDVFGNSCRFAVCVHADEYRDRVWLPIHACTYTRTYTHVHTWTEGTYLGSCLQVIGHLWELIGVD